MRFKQEAKKENKISKKEKDPWKPKHPMSAFFLFTNGRRPALAAENKTVTEITGEEWKNMTEEQKLPYEEMTRKNKEKYIQEMEAYKEMKEEEASNLKKEKHEVLQLLKKKEKTENIIKEARKALLEERPGTNSTTITAMISLKWKEMKEEEKKVWNEKAAEAMEAYKKEVLEHNKSVVAASSSAY
ncbi:hypothetical protein C1H46_041465 [Malus baccata]|uniref:HMG box domain-containing protein n=1 Tax=Malus baccata TaxID=106549 RepID=A0A540KFJ9_MALBA|nr:hypothetical protein C1H46_041465 [Malus baccata]